MNNAFLDVIGFKPNSLRANLPDGLDYRDVGPGLSGPRLRSGLLCTARSGSSFLSVALEAYGFRFNEYLNRDGHILDLMQAEDIRSVAQLTRAVDRSAVFDGRFSTKLPPAALLYLFLMGEFPQNMSRWRFVYLRRQNLVRQAISGVIAKRTGQWTQRMTAHAQIGIKDYDFDEIMRAVEAAANGNRLLERFIGLFGLPVRNIIYENLVANGSRVVRDVATFLGADPADYPDANKFKPWIEVQATALNDIWERRFRDELRRRSIYTGTLEIGTNSD